MTPNLAIDRALEIIASHGADARRWPAAESSQMLALIDDPRIVAALAEARSVDAMLGDWVVDTVPAGRIDLAAITGLPQQTGRSQPARSQQVWRGWVAGGAIAAAVAALAVLTPMHTASTSQIAMISNATVPSATVESGAAGSDADAFATVFTPTADEDELI